MWGCCRDGRGTRLLQWENVGDAGNASIAHVSLEAVCTGKVGFFMDLDCQMRNERGKE